MTEEDLTSAVNSIDNAMRADEDCDSRVITVTEQQYHSLTALQDGTYDTNAGAIHKLLRKNIKINKVKNGILDIDDIQSDSH